MLYPNDITQSIEAHQHYLCDINSDYIEVYTISSKIIKTQKIIMKSLMRVSLQNMV